MKKIALVSAFLLGLVLTPVLLVQANVFSDVGRYDWFSEYVGAIKDWGIVSGNDDGTFAPERYINRAEFSKMIYLYDQRIDEKISSRGGNPSAPATVMYMERFNGHPEKCPSGWSEAGFGKNWEDEGTYSYKRTCYVNKSCTVMYLEIFNGEPNACPRGWEQSDYGEKWREGGKVKRQRTCFVCAG